MDSNKDFIHIDELFRNLQNEPTATYKNTDSAWEKMRTQLDKEMPTGGLTANGSSKRRYFYPLLALLLASSAGSFGYWLYLQPGKGEVAKHVVNEKGNKSIATQQKNANTVVALSETNNNEAITSVSESVRSVITKSSNRKSNISQHNNFKNKAEIDDVSTISKNTIPANVNAIVQNRIDLKEDKSGEEIIAAHKNIENRIQQGPSSPQSEVKIASEINEKNAPATKVENQIVKTGIEDKEIVATSIVAHDNGNVYVKTEDGSWYEKSQKTVQIQHFQVDAKNEERLAGPSISKTINELKPVADPVAISLEPASSNTSEAELAVGVKKEDVTLGQTKGKGSNNVFSFIVKKSDDFANLFINSPTFSAIMSFGANYTAIGGGSVGYQFGIGSMYYLGERLSLGLELKYINNQFFNYQYKDNSQTYVVEQNGATFNGIETIENNSYTFNSINRLQVPLYLNYYFTEKMALIGGFSINYAAPIKYKVENEIKVNNQYVSLQNPQQNPLQINAKNDFKSNIGMGYVIGLGVDINKNWNIDFRVSQNFMNNAKSENKFVHSLYQNPNFQLNMVFNIGKKKKEMMLMNTRN